MPNIQHPCSPRQSGVPGTPVLTLLPCGVTFHDTRVIHCDHEDDDVLILVLVASFHERSLARGHSSTADPIVSCEVCTR